MIGGQPTKAKWPFALVLTLAAITVTALGGCPDDGGTAGVDDDLEPADMAQDWATDLDDDADGACVIPDVVADPEAEPTPDAEEDSAADPDYVDVPDVAADPPLEDVADSDPPIDADDEADVAPDPDAVEVLDSGDLDGEDDDSGTTFACGDALTDERDGASYATVLIGGQCWMAQNLDVGTRIAGETAQTDNDVIEKYCFADDPAQCAVHGGLYQWDELMAYAPSDAGTPSTTRGICPAGWHVPSDAEWQILEIELGMSEADAALENTWRGAGVGTALKVDGSSGFEALMSGRWDGAFRLIGVYTYFYTATESGTPNAWRRCLAASADDVGRWDTFPKTYAFSLRCVLD